MALQQCKPIAVQRAPILQCLTVPLKGVSLNARKPFKLPGGVTNTEKSEEMRKKKTLGARLNLCKYVACRRGGHTGPPPRACMPCSTPI